MSQIKAEHLSVGYGKKIVLSDLSFAADKGQVVTLIGPNGAGKSTILKTFIKQLAPLGGVAYVGEKSIARLSEKEMALQLSVVMTGRLKPELMTCREVVATGRYPYTGRLGILGKEDWLRVDEAMHMVHAMETADCYFQQISDGQKQRVMLARAICQDTQVLILDEPTSYLDIRYKLDIMESIRLLAKEKGRTVLMSLHELDLARMISDVILCVDGEKISKIGSPEEIFQGTVMETLYHIKERSYDPVTGAVYLERAKGAPQGFVIGGGGRSLALYSYLNRQRIPFVAGLLWEDDVAYSMAVATAGQCFSQKSGYPFPQEEIRRAKEAVDACLFCVSTKSGFGPLEEGNRIVYNYAKERNKLIDEEEVWQK
ncbi:iron complex transport system ATP-binding protein [Lachnospiraceae bacterium XBB1006]|nr:iron complex transport system ATP-binding protein [Lachnospiraceae bacterium XBB1006]